MKELLSIFDEKIQSDEDFIFLETLKSDSLNFKSFVFLEPVCILETSNIDEVGDILQKIEGFVNDGYYAAGYVTYEAGYAFETKLKSLVSNLCVSYPLIRFGIFKNPHIIDMRNGDNERFEMEEYSRSYQEMLSHKIADISINMSEIEYKNRINRIKDYLRSGDTYQINFTWNIDFSFGGSPFALYCALREKQKVSYAAFIKSGNSCIVSFSPELFFRRTGDKIITSPMKGTIKRGRTLSEDRKNMKLLRESEKNRAENTMIVDLLRNDLSKISETGSVEVSKLFEIEKYKTLFQMTSTIEGRLKPETTYYQIFKNLFPCGSVTGAPKIRSMEIINELEKAHRGVYTGAVGYISPYKEAVFNVAIRSPVISGRSGTMGIGSGIVWDSEVENEYRECRLKMGFLIEPPQEFKLLETILYYKGRYWLLKHHIQRLRESAEYFNFKFDTEVFITYIKQNAKQLDNGKKYKVKILVDKSGRLFIENFSLDISRKHKTGYVALAGKEMDSGDIFLFHKTTKRQVYNEMYSQACEKGLVDLIFTNEKGEVTEGCISNIFIKRNKRLITPPVNCGLLNGIMRQYIMRKIKNVTQDVITLEDLQNSEEIYLCNSVRGIMKVKFLD